MRNFYAVLYGLNGVYSLYAFDTKAERDEYVRRIRDLIPLSRREVLKEFGSDFGRDFSCLERLSAFGYNVEENGVYAHQLIRIC